MDPNLNRLIECTTSLGGTTMVAENFYYSESHEDILSCIPLPKERDVRQLELDLQIPSELDSYIDQTNNLWFINQRPLV